MAYSVVDLQGAWLLRLIGVACIFVTQTLYAQTPLHTTSQASKLNHAENEAGELQLTRPDSSSYLGRTIIRESALLDSTFGFSTDVYWSSISPTTSHPELGIILNRPQLERLSSLESFDYIEELVAFVLAHEKAHQIQYDDFGVDVFQSGCEDVRVLEAQADIYAGSYYGKRFSGLSDRLGFENLSDALEDQDFRAYLEVFDVAFRLGTRDYSFATHPSQESRRSAIKLGLTYRFVKTIEQALIRAREQGRLDSLLAGPGVRENIRMIHGAIDYRAVVDFNVWSLHMAQRLVSFSRPTIAGLVQTSADVEWSVDNRHPFVYYDLVYKNVGNKRIGSELMVQVQMIEREQEDRTKLGVFVDGRTYEFSLYPNQVYSISDSLRWSVTSMFMPTIVFPPYPTAMVSVIDLDAAVSEGQPCGDYYAIETPSVGDIRNEIVLRSIINDISNRGFEWLAGGVGWQRGEAAAARHHPAAYSLFGSTETTITLPNTPEATHEMTSTLYEGVDSTAAVAIFRSYANLISSTLPDWTRDWSYSRVVGQFPASTSWRSEDVRTELEMMLRRTAHAGASKRIFKVRLSIQARNR